MSVKGSTQDTLEFCGGQFGIYQGESVPSVVRSNTEHKITMYLNFEIFREIITQIHEFVCFHGKFQYFYSIPADVTPFMLRTFFVGNSAPSGSLEDQVAGFNIQWKQVPCGGK